MKRLSFLLLMLLLSTATVQAQQRAYQSLFGKDTTTWHFFSSFNEPSFDPAEPTIVFRFTGRQVADTALGGISYKRPWIYIYYKGNIEVAHRYFLMREDTLTGKVYERILDPVDTTESVIMDFSLHTGDSFQVSRFASFKSVVDSVFYDGQGRKHVRVAFNSGNKVEYTEGIGSSWCLTQYKFGIPAATAWALICNHKDGVLVYQDSSSIRSGSCFTTGALSIGDNQISEAAIQILPNPAAGNAILQFSQEGKYRATVYDLQGRMLWQKETTEKQLAVPSQHWPTGMYYIQVINQERSPQYLQFVKQ